MKVKHFERSKREMVAKADRTKKDVNKHLAEIDKVESETTKTRDALEGVKKDDKERRQTIQRLQREIDDGAKSLGERPDRQDPTELNEKIVSRSITSAF